MKVVRLSALRTGRLYHPENIPATHFCYSPSRPQGHSAAGRIMSMKNFNDTIGSRTRDLPTCSAVPHPSKKDTHVPSVINNTVRNYASTFLTEYDALVCLRLFLPEDDLTHVETCRTDTNDKYI